MKRALCLGLAALALSSCAAQSADEYLGIQNLTTEGNTLAHCYGYGCAQKASITLSDTEWQAIEGTLIPPAQTPLQERDHIARAVALFEQYVGAKAGTDQDKGGTFAAMSEAGKQLDCIDESINTTIYLQTLYQNGLLHHHTVQSPTTRTPLFHPVGWPHRTAIITDTQTGTLYAVDSWFHDNGSTPEIIPLKQWKDGWKPSKEDAQAAPP